METADVVFAAGWIADARPDLTFNAQPTVTLDWDEGLSELERYGRAGIAVQLAEFHFGDLWWCDPEGRDVTAHRFLLLARGCGGAVSIQYLNYEFWQSRFTSALLDAANALECVGRGQVPGAPQVLAGLVALRALNRSSEPVTPTLVEAADLLHTLFSAAYHPSASPASHVCALSRAVVSAVRSGAYA